MISTTPAPTSLGAARPAAAQVQRCRPSRGCRAPVRQRRPAPLGLWGSRVPLRLRASADDATVESPSTGSRSSEQALPGASDLVGLSGLSLDTGLSTSTPLSAPGSAGRTSIDINGIGAGSLALSERIADLKAAEATNVATVETAPVEPKQDTKEAAVPTQRNILMEIVAFAVPALGSVLADPLMSLVDTACVGQYSSLHLAALAPNTSVFNLFFQIFTFLGYTTTNLIASNSVRAAGLTDKERATRSETASRVLAHSLVLAFGSGLACTAIMLTCGHALLTTMGATPDTLGPALSYLQIRALASPAVMIANVAQGACLGQQDSWTPLKVFATSGLVNLVLDLVLINNFHMGIAGAAMATTFAQVVAAGFFMWYCHHQGKIGAMVPLKWHGLPTLKTLAPFWEVANTLMSRTMFTCAAYTGVSTISASMGFLTAAAHQVALQVYWFLSYVPESLSLTAQSLIARDMNQPRRARAVSRTLMKLSGAVGVALAAVFYAAMTVFPWMFSSDAAVHAGLQHVVAPGALACVAVALAMTFDGIGIGSGRYSHLPRNNMFGFLGCIAVALAASHFNLGLMGTWSGFTVFMSIRVLGHLWEFAGDWHQGLFGQGDMNSTPAMA
eukprot:jgi/Tetstr1/440679/TSEL_028988.t1